MSASAPIAYRRQAVAAPTLYLHQGLTVLPQDLVLEAPITEALQRNELQHLQLGLSSSNEAHDVLKHCLAVTFLENGCRAQKKTNERYAMVRYSRMCVSFV